MSDNVLQFYGAIAKYDTQADGSLMVSGIVSTEDVDNAGEIVTADAMRKALGSYLSSGIVREMHQPIASGRTVSAFVDDDGKTHATVHVVDKGSIDKIKAGVLKGFSIGGKAIKKAGNKILELFLGELSLVDAPCNPNCVFTVIKFDKPEDKCNDDRCKTHKEPSMKKCKHCDEPMEKCGGDCEGMKSEKASMKKMDDLIATVEALTKSHDALKGNQPKVKIGDEEVTYEVAFQKLSTVAGDLLKKASETQKQVEANERDAVIRKMDSECRVAFNHLTNVAYTAEELQKLDLGMLKMLSVNSPSLPTKTRAIYKGSGKPQVDPTLKGTDKTAALWENRFPSLDIAKAQMGHSN